MWCIKASSVFHPGHYGHQVKPIPADKPTRPRRPFLAPWQELPLLGQGALGITHIPPTLICLFDLCSAPRHPCILLLFQ